MKLLALIPLIVVAGIVVSGCGASFDGPATRLDPVKNPCGAWPVACADGSCCDESYVCGGPQGGYPSTCPADMCCTDGPTVGPEYGASRKPRMVPKKHPKLV